MQGNLSSFKKLGWKEKKEVIVKKNRESTTLGSVEGKSLQSKLPKGGSTPENFNADV